MKKKKGLFLVGYNWQNSRPGIPVDRVRAWRAAREDYNQNARILTHYEALEGCLITYLANIQ